MVDLGFGPGCWVVGWGWEPGGWVVGLGLGPGGWVVGWGFGVGAGGVGTVAEVDCLLLQRVQMIITKIKTGRNAW